MTAFYGAACALGAVAGIAFACLWLRIVPPGTNAAFWSAMSELCRRLLAAEEAREFLALYRRLGALSARYVARNLAGSVVGCLPMIAILFSVGPLVFNAGERSAERVAYCASDGYCALFDALDFEVIRVDSKSAAAPYAVKRASHHGDANPLWPLLSDIEATFFAMFMLATVAGLLWPRTQRS